MIREMVAAVIFGTLFTIVNAAAPSNSPSASPPRQDNRKTFVYGDWEVFMLGIDTPVKSEAIKNAVRRKPRIAVVGASGVKESMLEGSFANGSNILYINGSEKNCRNNHDTYQISEVLLITGKLHCPVEIQVYIAAGIPDLAAAFDAAGKSADIVVTYHSFWRYVKPLQDSVAANPDTLYIAPYAEVGPQYHTGEAFQAAARHPNGTGLRNFITTIPLARDGRGELLTIMQRNEKDSETINFIAPSSYATTSGTTCPSVGVTAAVAAWIISASDRPDITAEEIISLMARNVTMPTERMLQLVNYNKKCVQTLQEDINTFVLPDQTGIRRLEAPGVLDLWQIYEELSGQNK